MRYTIDGINERAWERAMSRDARKRQAIPVIANPIRAVEVATHLINERVSRSTARDFIARQRIASAYQDMFGTKPGADFDVSAVAKKLMQEEA